MKTQQPADFFLGHRLLTVVIFLILQPPNPAANSIDSITLSRPLYPNETLISSGHIFELGFFRPNTSLLDQYIGIWYTNTTPVQILWVANRNTPLPYLDQSASLTIGSNGNLVFLDGQGNTFWSTNVNSSSSSGHDSSFALLLDNGNLVVRDASSGRDLWESFGDPTDTLFQTMKSGIDVVTGKKHYLSCWKSDTDPSPGNFVVGITSETPPQVFIWINGSIPYWRSGPWDKSTFIGVPKMARIYTSTFAVDQDNQQGTTYLSFNSDNNSVFAYARILSTGLLRFMLMRNRINGWEVNWEAPINRCEEYGTCGPFGVCDVLRSPICSCLEGFSPSSVQEWNNGNWSKGCTRNTELNCESMSKNKDVFWKKMRMKLPDSSTFLQTIYYAEDCLSWCLNNCSCLAYSFVNTIGCMTWSNKLMDIQQFNESGEDLFLRLTYINRNGKDSRRKQKLVITLSVIFCVITALGLGGGIAIWAHCTSRTKLIKMFIKLVKRRDPAIGSTSTSSEGINISWKEKLKIDDGQELLVFNFDSILTATDNFSSENKLGKGGFGSVYKGKLQDGRNIAVKRLSSNSGQGVEEFKTEIILISKLQHRNLVRLIGCCIEDEEKILIYEYLRNKSLDTFIFDPTKKMELDWTSRFKIIQGIARGLLYLHRDSQLRVIHRDLKASNILLDENLNPKISDFGLARMFPDTRVLENTRRIVGTLGYMAPEYAMIGMFSEKSDIYSFGVLLLEIVSSKKNTSFYYNQQHVNLLSYTWRLWKEGKLLNLVDEEVHESSSLVEVEKCIQVGLMCVQDRAADRPHMSSIIQMLAGEFNLSEPNEPAYSIDSTPSYQERRLCSTNNFVTNSTIQGR